MKRDGMICCLIFLYCLVLGLFMLKPQILFADHEALASVPQPVQTVRFTQLPDSPDPNQVFELVNHVRAEASSPALLADTKLAELAAARAADMAANHYYAHKDPSGKLFNDYFQQFGIQADYSCENLDLVFVPDIQEFIREWSASTRGHRECMENAELTRAGYAVTNMMLLEYGGKMVPAYLVVAIHSTDLK